MPRRRRRNKVNLGCIGAVAGLFTLGILLQSTAGQVFVGIGVLVGGGSYTAIALNKKVKKQEAARLWAIRAQSAETYLFMTPKEFEHALAYLCTRDGCHNVRIVGGAGDLGADVIATTPTGERLVIQAKRYARSNSVKGPDLQKFGGTCYAVHHADVAAVVTTSRFTAQAKQYADHMNIRLFGWQELGAWASRTGPAPWMIG
ncbi:hypothetical protein GCM10023196_083340 [Actinoallomurus vinaceus]|uniref:Restriction endonuclease type IV Mrr domain-containing protein n=1 Tax=Actinoallomurus vinaceus TaxID=1080074 RepID=A0ABP8UMR1_9ACTN